MSWLLKTIIGNPMVLLWGALAVFAFGAATGGSTAWQIQGLRITHAQQEFEQYKQDQTADANKRKDEADKQREKASKDYEHVSNILSDEINKGVVFQRCVAAGKCGRVQQQSTCAAGIHLPPADGADETGTDAISALAGATADPVVNDCAATTLMINRLQADIESQPGYSR